MFLYWEFCDCGKFYFSQKYRKKKLHFSYIYAMIFFSLMDLEKNILFLHLSSEFRRKCFCFNDSLFMYHLSCKNIHLFYAVKWIKMIIHLLHSCVSYAYNISKKNRIILAKMHKISNKDKRYAAGKLKP